MRGIAATPWRGWSRYAWPGNVRELENVIERAVILAPRRPHHPARAADHIVDASRAGGSPLPAGDLSLRRARRAAEAEPSARALRATDGNRTHGARLLEISHRALLYKLKEYGIRD